MRICGRRSKSAKGTGSNSLANSASAKKSASSKKSAQGSVNKKSKAAIASDSDELWNNSVLDPLNMKLKQMLDE